MPALNVLRNVENRFWWMDVVPFLFVVVSFIREYGFYEIFCDVICITLFEASGWMCSRDHKTLENFTKLPLKTLICFLYLIL